MDSLKKYHDYLNGDEDFLYRLRMTYEWDETLFRTQLSLVEAVLDDYKESALIPKSVVYFFASTVDLIAGIVSNDYFYATVPEGFTADTYKVYINERVGIILTLKKRFFAGEI